MKFAILFSSLLLLTPFFAGAHSDVQSMQTEVVLDIVAPLEFEESEASKLDIRSVEILLHGPLDSTFDGMVNFAAHNEDGEYKLAVHEAYLSSSKLIPSSRFKIGKFFLGIGHLNQHHQHDWAFTSAPRVYEEFFGEEALIDSGAEYSILLPFASFWEITLGVTNGYSFVHEHNEETAHALDKPHVPTHYIHPVTVVDFGELGALQWGPNYLGRTDSVGIQTQLYGFDFVFKNPDEKDSGFLLQSEIWYRNQSGAARSTQEDVGAYLFTQLPVSDRLAAGARIDLFKDLSKTFVSDGTRQDNLNYALVPTLTYKHSEHTTFRASYSYDIQTNESEANHLNQKIELQFITHN